MTWVTRIAFAGASLILLFLAMALIGLGAREVGNAFTGTDDSIAEAVLNALGYVIVATAVFDVAKYLFEEEVRRGAEKRSAAEARRSLTKFLTTIIIALFLDGLVMIFKTSREDITQLLYPVALILAATLVLVGLGVFQRLSATVEEKVGDSDDADEAEQEAVKTSRRRTAKR